jgi:lactoylglutathione lyase
MVSFGYTILYVSDVTQSVEFYEQAFGFERRFITPENDYAELVSGQTTLAFVGKALANSNLKAGFIESDLARPPFAMELALVTDQVDEVLEKAKKAGATMVEAPTQKPWGQTVAYLRDIDGFLLEICTPIGQ